MRLDRFNQRDEKSDLTGRDAEHPFNEFGLELGDLKVEISFGYQFLVHQVGQIPPTIPEAGAEGAEMDSDVQAYVRKLRAPRF